MKYMGSKRKLVNDLVPIFEQHNKQYKVYWEPFCGGLSTIQNVSGYNLKIASDLNPYLIAMWKGLQLGFDKPMEIPKTLYDEYRSLYHIDKRTENYDRAINLDWSIALEYGWGEYIQQLFLIGWIGFMASFNGRFYDGGYSGKSGKRDYVAEQINNTLKQIPYLKDIVFRHGSYSDFSDFAFGSHAVIYCDIPYKNTTPYGFNKNFDYDSFYVWCRKQQLLGNKVYISEYQMPEQFKCIWEKQVTNSMNTTKTYKPTERLFTLTEWK